MLSVLIGLFTVLCLCARAFGVESYTSTLIATLRGALCFAGSVLNQERPRRGLGNIGEVRRYGRGRTA